MPLSVTQTQVLAAHLTGLHQTINPESQSTNQPDFTIEQVLASMCQELGPFVLPMIANAIKNGNLFTSQLRPTQTESMLTLLDEAEADLETSLAEETAPGRSFLEIIAQLLEQLGPLLIQILIGFLREPDKYSINKFSNRN